MWNFTVFGQGFPGKRLKVKMEEHNEGQVNPLLLEFLDLDTYKQRSEFLMEHKNEIDDRCINDMAMSQDIVLEERVLEMKIYDLIHCMDMHAKYETNRFR